MKYEQQIPHIMVRKREEVFSERFSCAAMKDVPSGSERIFRFLSDRDADTYLGQRRVSRLETVLNVSDEAERLGFSVSVYPDVSGTDILIFPDWVGYVDEMRALRRKYPSLDILYGQDLCHQVPAVVRFRE